MVQKKHLSLKQGTKFLKKTIPDPYFYASTSERWAGASYKKSKLPSFYLEKSSGMRTTNTFPSWTWLGCKSWTPRSCVDDGKAGSRVILGTCKRKCGSGCQYLQHGLNCTDVCPCSDTCNNSLADDWDDDDNDSSNESDCRDETDI